MGRRLKFLTDAYAYSTLDISSQDASYPGTNINDPFRSRVWRSNTGYFEINSANRDLLINDTSSDILVTMDISTYTTGAGLASHLQTKLNAASSGFTVAYSATTNKFTISRSSDFELKWSDSSTSCADVFGYNDASDDTGTDTYEADVSRICYPYEFFKYDFGTSVNPKGIVIIDNIEERIKIQNQGLIFLQGSHSDSWINPEEVALEYSINNLTKINMDGLFSTNYRFNRLVVKDISNPLGYQQLGKIYLGDVYELEGSDVQRRMPESSQSLSSTRRALGGEKYTDIRPSFDVYSDITVQYTNKNDKNKVRDIWDRFRDHTPFFISIDSEAHVTDDVNEWTKYVRFTSAPRYQQETPTALNIRMSVEEEV